MGSKGRRLTALGAAFALSASFASGLLCLAMPAATLEHGCCPPEAGFEAAPAVCCDARADATPLPAAPTPDESSQSLHTGVTPLQPPSFAAALTAPAPPSPPAINLRI
jgi:hypothetical protein